MQGCAFSVLESCAFLLKECLVIHTAVLILKTKSHVNTLKMDLATRGDALWLVSNANTPYLELSKKTISEENLIKSGFTVGMSVKDCLDY